MILLAQGKKQAEIAKALGRSSSTISRELKRHALESYSATNAQNSYLKHRQNSKAQRKLEQPEYFNLVQEKFLTENWSPEQISARLLNLQSKCNKKRSTHQLEYNFVSTQKPLPNDEYFLPTSYNKRARKDNDFTRTGQKTSRNCQSTGT
uniref:Transposase IS30-like HTH domain-containing protein n=1 Tax=Escherichia coli TaxID=562 RepID=A0A1U9XHA5_ECOLX|nr:hypothetical protein pGD80-2_00210 [Escherichia coli]